MDKHLKISSVQLETLTRLNVDGATIRKSDYNTSCILNSGGEVSIVRIQTFNYLRSLGMIVPIKDGHGAYRISDIGKDTLEELES